NWQQRPTTGPLTSGRRNFGMAYDAVRQRVTLFGGENNSSPGPVDTEEWDGTAWAQASPVTSPTARYGVSMAFDDQRQRLVLFGGNTNGDQTWTRGQLGTVATATPFGNGCGNPPLALATAAGQRPVIGQNGGATLAGVPTTVAAVAIGWSRSQYGPFALPVTLGGIGMQGCDLLQSTDVFGLPAVATGPGSAEFTTALPNVLGLVGTRVYLQGYAFAPGANALSVIVSNGVEWFIGDL
ncbi:MAG: hypothetical protein JNK15_05210, partial [Planctomycetes bacterium]|nr:hypothetical protein [Planctomycetota bacterium]